MRSCNKCKKQFEVGLTFAYETKTKGKESANLCPECCSSFVMKMLQANFITTKQLFEYTFPK